MPTDTLALAGAIPVDIGWMQCDPGYAYGPTSRDYTLIHYVTGGKGQLEKEGRVYPVATGEFFTIFPDEITTYRADEQDPWQYHWVGFTGPLATALLADTALSPEAPVHTLQEPRREVIRCVRRMYTAARMPGGGMTKAAGLLLQFLSYIQDSCPRQPAGQLTAQQREYLSAAMVYIHENLAADLTVASIASHIGIDRSYLFRIFQEHNGVGPARYIIDTRLNQAADMLRGTNRPIVQIAMDTGFSSASHLAAEFKAANGVTPSAYRKSYRQAL